MPRLYDGDLFERVLVAPAEQGCNDLHIVSGYAAATMASRHMNEVAIRTGIKLSLSLIVGMTPSEGVTAENHSGFMALMAGCPWGAFSCSYVMNGRSPVHSKVYVWTRDGVPEWAFAGSANYTQRAFFGRQREVLTECDPAKALHLFNSLDPETVTCTYGEVEDLVRIQKAPAWSQDEIAEDLPGAISQHGWPKVTCPLVQRDGRIHTAGGLNWGQRAGRDPNQAYIPVPAAVSGSDFFPPRGEHFTVLTDDGKWLICVRAQDDGKAIEIPADNSQLGEYFRNRLGLANGVFVTREDLERYGRTDVDFYKTDDGPYLMDFSPPSGRRMRGLLLR